MSGKIPKGLGNWWENSSKKKGENIICFGRKAKGKGFGSAEGNMIIKVKKINLKYL